MWATLKITFFLEKFSREGTRVRTQSFFFCFFSYFSSPSQFGDDSLPAAQDRREEGGGGSGHQGGCRGQKRLHQGKRTQTPQSSQGQEVRWLLCLHKYQLGAVESHREGFLKEMKNSRKSRSSEAVGFVFLFFFAAKRL